MIEQGDIVIIPFPFSHYEEVKERPSLVVSNDSLNRSHDIIVVAISSQPNELHGLGVKPEHIIVGNLSLQGFIHAHKILRIQKSRVIRIIASVSPAFLHDVIQKIHDYLKLEEKKM